MPDRPEPLDDWSRHHRRLAPPRVMRHRFAGLAMAGLLVAGGLWQAQSASWLYALLLLHCALWPWAACRWACRAAAPAGTDGADVRMRAEYRNFVVDAGLGGFWIAAMGINLLPAALLVSVTAVNCMSTGGPRLLLRALPATAAGLGAGLLLLQPAFVALPALPTVLACLPLLAVHPLSIAFASYKLSCRLLAERSSLAASERLHRETLDAMPAGVVLYDQEDRLILANRTFRQGFARLGSLLDEKPTFVELLRAMARKHLHPVDVPPGEEEAWVQRRLQEHRQRSVSHRHMRDGTWRRILDTPLPNGGLLSFSIDITEVEQANAQRNAYAQELHQLNQRLQKLSATDELTGLANRRRLDQQLQVEWDRCRRHGLPLAVLMIDVDHFKQFNDAYGHLEGDRCLQRIAQALAGCAMRASDLVARYGGEEFVVLLPHAGLDDALRRAQQCMAAVDALRIAHVLSSVGDVVTLSIGVAASSDGQADSATALLRAADQALYRAKGEGRHRVLAALSRQQHEPGVTLQ